MRRSPCTTAGENQKRIQASALLFFREIFKCRIKPGAASAALPPPGRFGGPSLKRRCGRTRGRRVKRERDATRAFLKLVSSPARFNDGAAQLAAQRADTSKVVPPKGSKSRSNQPPAAGGPSIKPPPRKPDCSGQAGVSAWRHHPARCRDCTTPRTAADLDLQRAGQQRTPIHHGPPPRGLFCDHHEHDRNRRLPRNHAQLGCRRNSRPNLCHQPAIFWAALIHA